jgi:hypothetical protein
VRGGRVAIAAVSAVLLGLVFAGSALACSCAPTAPAESLARSDAAVVGRLLGVEPQSPTQARYRYRVLRVYRGRTTIERGAVLTVLSPRGSSACALPDRVERDYGLFLLGGGGRWASGLCAVISPRRLWATVRRAREGGESAASGRPGWPGCAG